MSYSDNIAFTYISDYTSRQSAKFDSEQLNFGDGYSQLIGSGCNVKKREYSLSFTRSISDCDAIETLLYSTKGVGKLVWTPPYSYGGLWTFKDYNRNKESTMTNIITFTFTEVFF